MAIAAESSYWQLVKYKLHSIALRDILSLSYLRLVQIILLHRDRFFPSAGFSPRFIQIEITTKCNLRCAFCEHTFWGEKSNDLKVEDFRKMLAHLPKLKRIELTGIGEPLMNREFFQIIELIKSRGLYVSPKISDY